MDLLSQLKLKSPGRAPVAAATPVGPGQTGARNSTRTRRRLVGSAMLLLLGVIVLPLLFEGQPRPLPGGTAPQALPDREGAADLPLPPVARMVGKAPEELPEPPVEPSASGVSVRKVVVAPVPVADEAASAAAVVRRSEIRGQAASGVLVPLAAAPAAPRVAVAAVPVPQKPAAAPPSPPKPAPPPAPPAKPAPAAAQAQAAEADRYIVQVGSFSEDTEVRSVRMRVEKLGLRTYVQVADSNSTRRVRVRVGPFSSKAEADRAASRIKAAGLGGSVLAL